MLQVRVGAAAVMLTLLLVGPAMAGVIEADLSVTKVDSPDPVLAGANLTYTITVQNAGPDSAVNVSLTDPVPVGTSFVSFMSPGGWTSTTPPVGGTGTVSSTIPAMAVGSAVFTLVVQVDPSIPNGAEISNTPGVGGTVFDPNISNNNTPPTNTTVGAAAPTPQASVPDAAMPAQDTGSPLAILGFAALLVGLLTASAVMAARRSRT